MEQSPVQQCGVAFSNPSQEVELEELKRIRSLLQATFELLQKVEVLTDNNLTTLEQEFYEKIDMALQLLLQVQSFCIHRRVEEWKFQQQKRLVGLGPSEAELGAILNNIQTLIHTTADYLLACQEHLSKFGQLWERQAGLNGQGSNKKDYYITLFQKKFLYTLTKLVQCSLIVLEQPPQVAKTGKNFSTKVSLLIGSKVELRSPSICAWIIREEPARNFQTTKELGTILNAKSTLALDKNSARLNAKFNNIKIEAKHMERGRPNSPKCSSDTTDKSKVVEEKFCMLFHCEVFIAGMVIPVRTISVPLVIPSHGSQYSLAEAVTIWDNTFCSIYRRLFDVQTTVKWNDLVQAISGKFIEITEHPPSAINLECFREKLFKIPSEYITWDHFSKEPLSKTTRSSFSFWDWVYGGLKVIKKKDLNIKPIVKAGLLMGFVSKKQANEMLAKMCPGTFILLFSESNLESITIAFVNDKGAILRAQPMGDNELKHDELLKSIRDYKELKFLYPNIPKDKAFGELYKTIRENPVVDDSSGYVRRVRVLENNENNGTLSPCGSPAISPTECTSPERNNVSKELDYSPCEGLLSFEHFRYPAGESFQDYMQVTQEVSTNYFEQGGNNEMMVDTMVNGIDLHSIPTPQNFWYQQPQYFNH